MTFRTLTDRDFDAVLQTFGESFSDYALNVDARDAGVAAFVRACRGTLFVEQFEMSRTL